MNSAELSQKILQLTQIKTDYLANISKILNVKLHRVEQVEDPFLLIPIPTNIELYQSEDFDNGSLLRSVEAKIFTRDSENIGTLSLSLVEGENIYVEELIDGASLTKADTQITQIIPEIDSCLITYPVNGNHVIFYQKIADNYKLTDIIINTVKANHPS